MNRPLLTAASVLQTCVMAWRRHSIVILTMFALTCAGVLSAQARSDTITFKSTGIALRGCRITAIQGGQVSYTDASGQRQRRPLDQVEALGFDGLPELDLAEAAISIKDMENGWWQLLRAAARATASNEQLQRIWTHVRLAQVHDLRGEYVQAAGHAAEVFALTDDTSWRVLRPVSPLNTPTYAAAHEANERIKAAMRRVRSSELQRELEIMSRLVQNVRDRLAPQYAGEAIEQGSTISGWPVAIILANERMPTDSATTPASQAAAPVAQPRPSAPAAARRDAIDELLESGRAVEALRACEEAARTLPSSYAAAARLLYQHGRALMMLNRKRDAAVMFTRCAILHPDSEDALPSLIETAVIYRDEYRQPETSRRLLQRVIAEAQRQGRQPVVLLAEEVLGTLPRP